MIKIIIITLISFILPKTKNSLLNIRLLNIFILLLIIITFNTQIKTSLHYSIWISDQFSIYILSLTFIIVSISIITHPTWKSTSINNKAFTKTSSMIILLVILTLSTKSLIIFYVIFEASLLPISIIIITWGNQPERNSSTFYIIIFTITSSFPIILAILFIYQLIKSIRITSLVYENKLTPLWWVIIILPFLIKMPIYPLHTWLPKAHVEAPTTGSIILAAILLKLGVYGLIRLTSINLIKNNLIFIAITLLIVRTSFIANIITIRQLDIKTIIAYSSVSHITILTAAIITHSNINNNLIMIISIAHGLTSSILFISAYIIYQKTKTRNLILTKIIILSSPTTSIIIILATITNISTPPTINFSSEIILVSTLISFTPYLAPIIILLIIISSSYSIFIITFTSNGQIKTTLNPTTKRYPLITIINSIHLPFIIIWLLTPNSFYI